MTFRTLLTGLLAVTLASCQSPYKKKDDADRQPLRDQAGDTSFQAFVGRLRIAVDKKDLRMLVTMMAPDFGYRWDHAQTNEDVFTYWDRNNLWPELSAILREKFVASDLYMVAPPQVVSDSTYKGYRAGARVVDGSWKFAYFVSSEGAQ